MKLNSTLFYLINIVRLTTVLLLLCHNTFTTALPIGYNQVVNQAYTNYVPTELGHEETIASNIVTATIEPHLQLKFGLGDAIFSSPDAPFNLVTTLTNTGNTTVIPTLSWSIPSAYQTDITQLKVLLDENLNGLADNNETYYSLGQQLPPLAAGASYTLIIEGKTSESVPFGSSIPIQLHVSGSNQDLNLAPTSDSVDNLLHIIHLPPMDFTLSSPQSMVSGDDFIELDVDLSAFSAQNIEPIPITIDGSIQHKVLIRYDIPEGMSFSHLGKLAHSTVLYHLANDPDPKSYVTAIPLGATIDAIAFAWDDLVAGENLALSFFVHPEAIYPAQFSSELTLFYGFAGQSLFTQSNMLTQLTFDEPNSLQFYTTPSYRTPVTETPLREHYYLEAQAPSCNLMNDEVTTYPLYIRSQITGEFIEIPLVQQAPNSDIFRAEFSAIPWLQEAMPQQTNQLKIAAMDNLSAVANCEGNLVEGELLIRSAATKQPEQIDGVVFDAKNPQNTLSGAEVALYYNDGTNKHWVSSTLSDAAGYYQLTLPSDLNPNLDFFIKVTKADYYFPTHLTPQQFTPYQITDGSYGNFFKLDSNSTTQKIDLPLQQKQDNTLLLSSSTNRQEASYGDWIEYTAKYQNHAANDFNQAKLYIKIPQGMSYVKGSARLNSDNIINQYDISQHGNLLIIALPQITLNSSNEINYLLSVNNSALLGGKLSTLHINANEGRSNNSYAKVSLNSGTLPDDGVVEGMVYADCNQDKSKNSEELGIPYVRLYLEDGRYVVTDANGLYSLYGVSPNNHVLKVDTTTLPKGAQLGSSGNRNNLGTPSMQFVDMKKGELHRADFIIQDCSPKTLEEINNRKKSWTFSEVEQQIKGLSTQKEGIVVIDHNATESVLQKLEQYSFHPATSEAIPSNNNPLSKSEIDNSNNLINLPLKEVLSTLDNTLNFIGLTNNQVMTSEQVKIRIKGPEKNTQLQLTVNGKMVDPSLIGERASINSKNIQAQEYVGVVLQQGKNELTLSELNQENKVLAQQSITVILPGPLKNIELIPLNEGVADGATPLPIVVKLLDAHGIPINTPQTITLESSSGTWGSLEDIDENQAGLQTRVNDGQTLVNLYADKPNIITVKASAEGISKTVKLKFNTALRPLIAVGIVDGALNLNDLPKNEISPIAPNDPFQRQLKLFMGNENAYGRTALFLKGKVKGNYLLTLAYDSDKQLTNNLDKQIDPNKYYAIYGDSSQNGQEAKSSSPLFLRLDKGSSYMLYGDYSTADQDKAISEFIPFKVLGKYARNATGLNGEYNGDNIHLHYFTAYTNYLHKQIEFQGKDISGPYELNLPNYVVNSEKISLVTRDKQQPQKIIQEQSLSAGTDYVLDIFGNSILFTRPIPSYDAQGNPIFVQVNYDINSGGKKFWFYGLDGQLELSNTLSIGANYISDQSIEADLQRLISLRLQQKFSENHGIVAEAAQSRNIALINDMAYRLEWHLKLDKLDITANWQRIGDNFTNSSAGATAGIQDLKLNLVWSLEKITLKAELISTEKQSAQTALRGGALLADFRINPSITFSMGARNGFIDKPDNNKVVKRDTVTSLLSKIIWQPSSLKNFSAYLEGEQSIQGDNRKILSLGSDYQLNSHISLYLKKQLLTDKGSDNSDAIPGNFGLLGNSGKTMSQIGVKIKINNENSLYTEYRGLSQAQGLDNQGAVGLNHIWKSAPSWLINSTFERVHSFTGLADDESSAATLGIEYTPSKDFKTYNRIEWRDSKTTQSMLVALSAAHSISPSFTALGSFIYVHERQKNNDDRNRRIDARIGIAYRDIEHNKLHLLARYQYHYDDKTISLDQLSSHVMMLIANYAKTPRLIFSGRYGFKYQINQWRDLQQAHSSQLLMGRFTYDITDKIDGGCMASALYGGKQRQYAYGCDIGYLVASNLWVSLGYNLTGFYDPEMSGNIHTQPGGYLNFRLRFDENAFNWLTE